MIVIDSSALIAIMRKEAGHNLFLDAIAAANAPHLSAFSYLEASMVLAGLHGDHKTLAPLDAFIARARVAIAPFDEEQALAARDAFLHYGKGRHPAKLNFGDCAAYALAKSRKAPLLFKGNDFAKTDIIPALRQEPIR